MADLRRTLIVTALASSLALSCQRLIDIRGGDFTVDPDASTTESDDDNDAACDASKCL